MQYYQLAYNLHRFNRLKWVMEQSLTKTLAHKLRTTVSTVYERFRASVQTPFGTTPGLRIVVERGESKRPLVAVWGGIALRRQMTARLTDRPTTPFVGRSELVQRLLAERCELCGSQDSIQVHHVRALKDLRREGRRERPAWVNVMAARCRKTLVVRHDCHADIHAGRPTRNRPPRTQDTGEPDARKRCAVSLGARYFLQGREVRKKRPPGHPPYLDAKARGESSMVGKHGTQRRRSKRRHARPA